MNETIALKSIASTSDLLGLVHDLCASGKRLDDHEDGVQGTFASRLCARLVSYLEQAQRRPSQAFIFMISAQNGFLRFGLRDFANRSKAIEWASNQEVLRRKSFWDAQMHFETLDILLLEKDGAEGQLSHPASLIQEIENIESVLVRFQYDNQALQILAALRTAVSLAQDAAATIAGVAYKRMSYASDAGLECEPFFADSEDLFRAEELRRRQESQSCVSIVVRQQDRPM